MGIKTITLDANLIVPESSQDLIALRYYLMELRYVISFVETKSEYKQNHATTTTLPMELAANLTVLAPSLATPARAAPLPSQTPASPFAETAILFLLKHVMMALTMTLVVLLTVKQLTLNGVVTLFLPFQRLSAFLYVGMALKWAMRHVTMGMHQMGKVVRPIV